MAERVNRRPYRRFVPRLELLEARLAPAFASFRAGSAGISVQDAEIGATNPTTPNPSSATISVADSLAIGGARQGLLRFNGLFGVGPGQIPPSANVLSASLTLWGMSGTSPAINVEFHRMLTGWSDTNSTWDSLGDGVGLDGIQASPLASSSNDMTNVGWNFSGRQVVMDVQAWQSGAASQGWVITAASPGASWSFASSEDPDVTRRPSLTVEYTLPGTSNPSYVDLVGVPPPPTKLSWFTWSDALRELRLARVPNSRTSTYYFSQNGNDQTGWGTVDQPWRSLAKAQRTLETTAGDVRLRFRRGDTWRETTTLSIERNSVTVDDYGDINSAKPVLSRFVPLNSNGWTLVQGNLYKYVAPPATGWVREASDGFSRIYYRAGSSAEVATRQYSWYYDANGIDPANSYQPALYLNAASNPALIPGGFEYCPDNGIGWSVYGDNVRFQNIRLEGQGISSNGVGYGLVISQFDRAEFVGVGVEVYYTGYHAIGQIVRFQGGHGAVTLVDVRAGLCVNRGGTGDPGSGDITVFVAYGDYGGNEYIQYQCTMAYGALPSSDWKAVPGMRHGQGMLSHVGPSGTLDLVIVTRTAANEVENPLTILNHVENTKSGPTLQDARGFIVEDQIGSTESVLFSSNVVVINCRIDRTSLPQYYPSLVAFYYYPFTVGSWLINCTIKIDASLQSASSQHFSYIISGIDSSRYINSHIDIFNSVTDLFIRYPNHPGLALETFANAMTLTNTIISFDTTKKSGLGHVNSAANLQHNAYYIPRRELTANWNYDNDPADVSLMTRYQVGTAPSPSSPLYNGGLDVGLEYDQLRRPRGNHRGIGPLTGSRLPLPTQVSYGWGNHAAPLVANSVLGQSTISRISLTFPFAVDVVAASLSVRSVTGVLGIANFTYNPVSRTALWYLAAPLAKGEYTLEIDGLPLMAFRVLAGDINGDRTVDSTDFGALRNAFGSSSVLCDINGDSAVSQDDFIEMRNNYGLFV